MTRKIARLKPKKVKGRIQVLKALPYKGHMVYVRHIIREHIFEYVLVFEKQIYSSYMIISPKVGQTKLSKDEISQATELLWAGAEATLEGLMGVNLDKTKADVVKTFEETREKVEAVLPN